MPVTREHSHHAKQVRQPVGDNGMIDGNESGPRTARHIQGHQSFGAVLTDFVGSARAYQSRLKSSQFLDRAGVLHAERFPRFARRRRSPKRGSDT